MHHVRAVSWWGSGKAAAFIPQSPGKHAVSMNAYCATKGGLELMALPRLAAHPVHQRLPEHAACGQGRFLALSWHAVMALLLSVPGIAVAFRALWWG